MDNERLARAIARIEQAAVKLGEVRPLTAPISASTNHTALKAELDSLKAAHKDALDDRERTIAKLRADIGDINALKDQEIKRLRDELQTMGNLPATAISEAEHQSLQQKYDRLRATAESTLTGLDSLISKAEQAENG